MSTTSIFVLMSIALAPVGCARVQGLMPWPAQPQSAMERANMLINERGHGQPRALSQAGENAIVKQYTPTLHDQMGARPASVVGEHTDLKVYLQLVQQMMEKDLFYAALAHLDALGERGKTLPEVRLLRADALRYTGQKEGAREGYFSLLSTHVAGQAHRGLGLLAAEDNKWEESVTHLWQANWLRPTDPTVRNDLGYALLLRGQIEQARVQLATAMELNGKDGPSAVNMVLLLLVEGEEEAAMSLVKEARINEADVAYLRHHAAELRARTGGVQAEPTSWREIGKGLVVPSQPAATAEQQPLPVSASPHDRSAITVPDAMMQ
jgi:Flp pilus assembly protein TadD